MFVPNAEPDNNRANLSGLKQVTGKKNSVQETQEDPTQTYLKDTGENSTSVSYITHHRDLYQMQVAIEKLKQELKASEARFQNAIAKNADSIVIVNTKGLVCFANPAAESLFNCKAEELLGKEFFGALVVEGSACELEVDTEVIPKVGQADTTGTRVVQTEVEALRKDKENAVVEMRVVETEWEGEIAYLASLRDITERKRTETTLWLYNRAMAATNTGIAIADATQPGYPLIYCNPAFERMTGYSRAEILGRNCRFLQGEDTEPAAIATIRQSLQQQNPCQVVLKNYRKDGTAFWNHLSISPVRDRKGTLIHFIGVQMDITERKKAEEALQLSEAISRAQATQLEATLSELQQTHAQLVQSEKMSSLGLLVAGVAHEINNPVSFIYGNLSHLSSYTNELLHLVELYRQHYPQPEAEIQEEIEAIELDFLVEDLTQILSSMNVGVERIAQIVRSLRNFSRQDESDKKPVNLHEGIDSTLLILNHRIKAKGGTPAIQIIKEYGDLPPVECYPGPINQVFMNILSNAIDALEETNPQRSVQDLRDNPHQIRISTCVRENQSVEVRITDNGPGIPEDVRQRIFEAFFTTKPAGKGTGMGLSISYQIIVERHKGKLLCTSAAGKGTEFIIQLPIEQ